jgi:SAM-dependent methyltransferase
VVEVGCGAGRLTAALTVAGFKVTAIEPSPALLEYARAAAPDATFVQGSAYDLALPECEAVVALGEPLTYHDEPASGPEKVQGFFAAASRALPPGGLLLFDVIETGEPSLSAQFCSSGDDWAILVDTREDQGSATLERDIDYFVREGDLYRRGRELHRVCVFDPAEVIAWLGQSGFAVETAEAYGAQRLPRRRRAFFATRLP